MEDYFSFLNVKKLSDIHDRTLMKCTVLINKSFPKYFLLPAFSPGREWKAFRKKLKFHTLKASYLSPTPWLPRNRVSLHLVPMTGNLCLSPDFSDDTSVLSQDFKAFSVVKEEDYTGEPDCNLNSTSLPSAEERIHLQLNTVLDRHMVSLYVVM